MTLKSYPLLLHYSYLLEANYQSSPHSKGGALSPPLEGKNIKGCVLDNENKNLPRSSEVMKPCVSRGFWHWCSRGSPGFALPLISRATSCEPLTILSSGSSSKNGDKGSCFPASLHCGENDCEGLSGGFLLLSPRESRTAQGERWSVGFPLWDRASCCCPFSLCEGWRDGAMAPLILAMLFSHDLFVSPVCLTSIGSMKPSSGDLSWLPYGGAAFGLEGREVILVYSLLVM